MFRRRDFAVCRSIIAAMLIVLVPAAGCGHSKEIKLDANDNGRQIEIEKGQILVIALEANPTTGYTWEMVESEEDVLQQIGEAEFQPRSKAVGASGTQTLRFRAVNAGQMGLELVYHRSWEEGVEPLEVFSISVVVK